MKIELKEKERIDDLELNGLKIIQDTTGFCFGIDSVLISDFAKEIPKNSRILDLGTGTGIIGTLLTAKLENPQIIGIEIQKDVAEMAKRSILLNNIEDKFDIINEDVNNIKDKFGKGTFDAIVTNPPYKQKGTGLINENDKKLISRHEITATLEDFIKVSFEQLKDKGSLYMVNKTERLVDIIEYGRKYKLEPKKIKFVHPYINKAPNLVLIKLVKNANKFLKIEEPIYVYGENGKYTNQILKIYGKDK